MHDGNQAPWRGIWAVRRGYSRTGDCLSAVEPPAALQELQGGGGVGGGASGGKALLAATTLLLSKSPFLAGAGHTEARRRSMGPKMSPLG